MGAKKGTLQKQSWTFFHTFCLKKRIWLIFMDFDHFGIDFRPNFEFFCNISRTFPGCRGTTDCTESSGLSSLLRLILHTLALPYASSTSTTLQIKRAGGGSGSAGSIRPPSGPGRARSSACIPIPHKDGFTHPFSFP